MNESKAVPSWLNKIRFITYYAFNPCEAPFMLYIEFAREPAKNTALIFLQFDLFAMVKRFFRPVGLRSRRHGRKGSRSGRGLRGVPEIADLVAEILPGQEEFAQRRYGFGTRLLYVLSDTYERAIWNIALVEISTDFVYDSLLGLISSDRANCPNIARCARSVEFSTVGGVGPDFEPLNLPILHYVRQYNSTTGFGAVALVTRTINVFACTLRAISPEVEVAIRLVGGITGDRIIEESEFKTIVQGEFVDLIVEGDAEIMEFVQWQVACRGGFADVIKADYFGISIAQ